MNALKTLIIILGLLAVTGIIFTLAAYCEARKIRICKPLEIVLEENRRRKNYFPISKMSPSLKMIIIGTEDNRFFKHRGIDYSQIVYAVCKNAMARRKAMGGSTITQQLAKNVYLSFKKTYRRKLQEFFLAYYIEHSLTKEEILELYLNIIYYGQEQYGIGDASRFWFHKVPEKITINEALSLASLLPAPSKYNPLAENGLFVKARKLALIKLRKHQLINDELNACLQELGYNEVLPNEVSAKYEQFYADEYARRSRVV